MVGNWRRWIEEGCESDTVGQMHFQRTEYKPCRDVHTCNWVGTVLCWFLSKFSFSLTEWSSVAYRTKFQLSNLLPHVWWVVGLQTPVLYEQHEQWILKQKSLNLIFLFLSIIIVSSNLNVRFIDLFYFFYF